jgi:DNA-directed RNA polymerase subunit L
MAKKKSTAKKEDDGINEELEEDLLGAAEPEGAKEVPAAKVISKEKAPASPSVSSDTTVTTLTSDQIAEKLSIQMEQEEEQQYKRIGVKIDEVSKNEYRIAVLNQSHGFCNYFVSKLLNTPGVAFAAYKFTSLEPASIDIKTDGSKEIKKILKEAIDKMRDELKMVGKLVIDLKI